MSKIWVERALPTQSVVQCLECKQLFAMESEDFFVFYGNVTIGIAGGLIGNNLSDSGQVVRATVVCRDCLPCFIEKVFGRWLDTGGCQLCHFVV